MAWFEAPPHTHHVFDRVISRSLEPGDDRVLFGCSFGRCAATELRREGERSPFAIKHQQATKRRAEARRTRARQGRA